jgi:hypothetical protein
MCALLRYCAGGLAALLTTAYVAASAERGISAFRPTVIEPAPAAITIVNRMNKGDREVTIRAARDPVVSRTPSNAVQNKPAAASREPRILEGCDPAFSPLAASPSKNFANRCMA